jgi:hypothetical protein
MGMLGQMFAPPQPDTGLNGPEGIGDIVNAVRNWNLKVQGRPQSTNIETAGPMDWAPESIEPFLQNSLGADFSKWAPQAQSKFMNAVYGMPVDQMVNYALQHQPGVDPAYDQITQAVMRGKHQVK